MIKMKMANKIISLLLTILTLLSIMSAATPVLATEVTGNGETESSDSYEDLNFQDEVEEESSANEPEVLNEMVEWRTESTKYFRNSDGSYTAAQYAYPIHYKSNGEWKEIDNTLTEQSSEGKTSSSDKVFIAKNTNTPAKFPNEFKQDGSKEITVTAEGYEISFSPKGNQKGFKDSIGNIKDRQDLESVKIVETANQVRNEQVSTFKATQDLKKSEIKEHNKKEKFKVENKSGTIVYENVFNNTNIEYELNNSKIKESIILKEKQDTYVFKFNMDLGELCPVMREDGSIDLCADKDGENPAAKIEAPYMIDSAGEYSDAVAMEITENDKEFVLTVTADEKWLNSKKRVYPVVIDPTIDLDVGRAKTYDCYIDNSQPNTAFPYDYYIYAGYSSYGKTRAYVKFDLPDLPDDSCIITNASITFYQYSLDNGNGSTQYMTIHNVTQNWNNADRNVTWNNDPSHDSTVLDYCKYDPEVGHPYQFDITKTVKSWYEGGSNYGVMLKSEDESVIKRAQLLSAENTGVNAYPVIEVSFLNNKGIESYWSYSSYSVNDAGAVHINDYTGNLVYELPIASSISEIMPVSIVGYYNNYCANELICETESKDVRTSIGRGFRLNYQRTVLPSSKYGLTGDNATLYPYVYTDEDGTEHYIQKTKEDGKTVYKDEDGLGLTLVTDFSEEGTYKITDKAHNKYYFNAKGNLFRITDNNGNEINIKYKDASTANDLPEKSRIDKIIDGAGHTYTFTYYDKSSTGVELDYVKKITDNAGRVINFDISGGLLRGVTYSNDSTATISYYINGGTDDSEGRINNITSNGNYSVNIDYTSKKTGRRVKEVKEYGITLNSDGTNKFNLGQVVTFDRSKYNTTVIRTPGLDGEHYSNDSDCGDDDILTTLQFDNSGKTISQQICLGDGTQSVAGAYSYTNKATTLASQNKITSSAGLGKNVVNYVKDLSGEKSNGWTYSTACSATGSRAYSTEESYIGAKSVKLTCTALAGSGTGVWAYQDITGLTGGRTYIFSAYVKVGGITSSLESNTYYGASLAIASKGAASNITLFSENVLETNEDTDDGWRRVSVTMTLPDDATGARVYLELRSVVGCAYFDCMSFEVGNTANPCNLLENSSFEKKNESTNYPENWSEIGLTDSDYVTKTKHKNGDYSLKIVGDPGKSKRVYQMVPVNGDVNDTYIVSAWAMANAVNPTYHRTVDDKGTTDTKDDVVTYQSFFEIHIKVFYDDGNGGTYEESKPAAKFNTTIDGWQYTAQAFSLKSTEHPKYKPIKIRIMPRYNNQSNTAYFDHIQLIKDVAQSYTYDKDGNPISVSANAEQEINTKYENNNLTSHKDVLGNETTLKYDTKDNLTVTKSPKGVYAESFYNTNGNITAQETRNNSTSANSARIIRTDKTYYGSNSTNGIKANAYLKTTSDEHGYETTYTHDWATGKTKSVTNALGTKTTYSYKDDYETLEKVAAGSGYVKYTYDKDRLTNILLSSSGNGVQENYYFGYDKFGNVTTTKIGEKTISTNAYDSHNGPLISTTYSTQDKLANTYDEYGNLKKVVGTDSGVSDTLYTWAYNSAGVTTIHRDYENAKRYFYYYDSIGRLIHTEIRTNSNNNHTHLGSISYEYDLRDNLKSVTMDLGGKTVPVQKYGYAQTKNQAGTVITDSTEDAKDNLPTRYKLTSTRYIDYEHDTLNRLNKKTLTTETPFVTSYIYKSSARNTDGGTTYRTTQLSTETIGGTKYGYTYDKVGNITALKKNDVDYRSYEYDSMSQLRRENNNTGDGFTKVWNYDGLGNIESVKVFDYNNTTATSDLGNFSTAIDYVYSDDGKDGWSRLLTSLVYKENTFNEETQETETTITETKTINYDTVGNPVKYLDHKMSWFGRQLKKIEIGEYTTETTDDKEITFTYGADGLRGTKTVTTGGNTVKSEYVYANGLLAYEKRGNSELFFFYDSYGHLTAIRYYADATKTTYNQFYAITNSMGDVIGFINSDGETVATYEYDAWGNCTITKDAGVITIAEINPIRYRGYYLDSETGYYYLQSRYYDPSIGRFLNADTIDVLAISPAGLTDKNLFAYCDNNPITRIDNGGEAWNIIIGAVVGGVISGVVAGVSSYKQTGRVDVGSVFINAGVGAISGAVAATGLGAFAQAGITAVVTGAGNFVEQCHTNGLNDINWGDVACSTVLGGLTSLAGTGAGKLVANKLNTSGTALINKGRDKLLTGVIKRELGQSHSKLIRQGTKFIAQGTFKVNTFRGISSVLGSGIGGASFGYNSNKHLLFGR